MLLSAGELSVYGDFAASVFGLGMPLVMVSVLTITGVHYWRRKKRKKKIAFSFNSAGLINSNTSLLQPPGTENEKLFAIKKIRKQLLVMKARQLVIRQDYLNYKRQSADVINPSTGSKNIFMENFEDKITGYEKQIAEMQRKIDMLETMPAATGNEAHYLRELLSEKENEIQGLRAVLDENQLNGSSNVPIDNQLVEEQRQEIERLTKLVSENEYLNELLDETRQQVNFMQGQLEQRIKANKVLEQRINSLSEQISQQEFQFHEAGKKIIALEQQLDQKEEAAGQLRFELDKKDNEIRELKEELHHKTDLINSAENSFNELMRENEQYKIAIANGREMEASLNYQLAEEKQANEYIRQELRNNRQLLVKFYQELKSSVKEEENEAHLIGA